ncbi:hypothetical protein GCM10020229_53850 [Kitasatospora albolonga]
MAAAGCGAGRLGPAVLALFALLGAWNGLLGTAWLWAERAPSAIVQVSAAVNSALGMRVKRMVKVLRQQWGVLGDMYHCTPIGCSGRG